jgi:L-threonylcarbamoyladenylate synthase
MAECWPGPLTLILKAKAGVPEFLTGGKETIAFRIPNHKGLQTLLKDFPILFSTSANLSGQSVPMKLSEVDQSILDACALAVLDEHKEESEPSTILDCSGDSIKLIRAGAFPLEKIEKIIGYSLNKH